MCRCREDNSGSALNTLCRPGLLRLVVIWNPKGGRGRARSLGSARLFFVVCASFLSTSLLQLLITGALFSSQVDRAFIRPSGELVRRSCSCCCCCWHDRGRQTRSGFGGLDWENSFSVVIAQAAVSTCILTWPLQWKLAININQEFHFFKNLMACLLKQCGA